MDGNSIAFLGELLAYAGDWERGCALAERAKQLNPNHPGWYWYRRLLRRVSASATTAARSSFALKVNLPGYWGEHAALRPRTASSANGRRRRKALRELLGLRPDFAAACAQDFEKVAGARELVERLLEGLRKAGLEVPAATRQARTPPETQGGSDIAHGAHARAAAVAIAVLPFADMSPARDQEYLCEGMAEEIMSALVRDRRHPRRVADLGVPRPPRRRESCGRSPTRHPGHVLEGSVRTAGCAAARRGTADRLKSGYQLWSERYDREAPDIFALQDEIATGVVEAVRSRGGAGRGAGRPAAGRQPRGLPLFLRGRHLRHTKNDHRGALRAYQEAARLDPSHAPWWVGVAECNVPRRALCG